MRARLERGNQMPALGKTLLAAVLLLGSSGLAAADPIVITRDARSVSAQAFMQACISQSAVVGACDFPLPPSTAASERHQGDELIVAPLAGGGFGGNVSPFAALLSDISDPRHMTGHGTTAVDMAVGGVPDFQLTWHTGNASGTAAMNFEVDFRLESPFNFAFVSPRLSGNFAHASLVGAGSVLFDTGPIEIGLPFEQSGQLGPGDYTLHVQDSSKLVVVSDRSDPSLIRNGGFAFTFDLTPVGSDAPAPTPEPTSLLLLGAGIVGTLGVRRRR